MTQRWREMDLNSSLSLPANSSQDRRMPDSVAGAVTQMAGEVLVQSGGDADGKPRATQQLVARKTGVSRSTVSWVARAHRNDAAPAG
jgi:hypothetical protein